ncbi:efflux RND transporter permease subunit [Nocardioides sp. zg-1228]|uniref:efflux RND transporter permease subunit n=1 Tax=Nocardioides sp. zg-1228 TaxID=2763008 RepID=UPI0016434B73|nr:efflux RND transporter permease subunit [Nocardioides sp. zg-1228]MBC2934286.1 efflux RND transporter permease subunit [Nocardioides sp. zg-1228]QSF59065.1 efflux RND transporter permease subunit [Nocardioides sp. zg-1228]
MGHLASFSLRNRALIALSTVMVAIFGVLSAGALKQELIPNLEFPAVGVVLPYAGASPEAVEQEVTAPAEQALSGVDGLEQVDSTSSSGVSLVLLTLEYGTDLQRAQQQAESAMSSAQGLPESVEPVVFAGSFDQFPVVQLAVTSDADPAQLAERIDRLVVPSLEDVEGVRQVDVTGAPTDRVEVTPTPAARQLGVSAADVSDALSTNASLVPAGTVDDAGSSLSVQVGATPTTLAELRRVPVSLPEGGTRPLGEVAEVRTAQATPTSYSRTNGETSLAVAITKTPDGNTVDISHAVAELIPELEDDLGDGAEFSVAFDQAPFIEKSVEDLTTEGALGLFFAVLVILLFLFSVRSTLVTALSIPLSLLVTLIGLRLGGYTLNILTLGALTVAIGRVVDDSIVVIENIKRHLSYGESKVAAITTAVREVGGAITSSTIATAAVFLPIGVVGGQVGELFRPFAVTVALALLASLLVSLTIIPVLAYWFLKSPDTVVDPARVQADAEAKEERSWLRRAYDPTVRWVVRRPWRTVGVAVVVLVATLGLTPFIKTNFLGSSGQNTLTVTQELEPGATLDRQDAAAREVESVLVEDDEVETVQSTVGTGEGVAAIFGGGATTFALTLAEDADSEAAAERIEAALADATGDVTVTAGDAGFASALELVVTATDQSRLGEAAEIVATELEGVDGIGTVTSDAAAAQPVLSVRARPEAEAAGLTSGFLGGVLAQALSQPPVGQATIDGEQLDVVVVGGPRPSSIAELRQLPVGDGASLGQVAELVEQDVATAITRSDGERTVTITAEPAADDLGSVTADVQALVDDLDLPEGTDVSIGGVSEDQAEAFGQLGLALLIAIAIVYVVMVATFKSLVQPLILLVSVPFAATGAMLLLVLTGIPLGVPSLIGALMLVGIVVTNAIVLIDLVNQRREAGASIAEALADGGGKRVRPIVMTALATILALTPMAFGVTGGSAFISQPLAVVVIGGLLSSTFLTLLLVPALYVLVERRKERRAQRRAERQGRGAREVADAPSA